MITALIILFIVPCMKGLDVKVTSLLVFPNSPKPKPIKSAITYDIGGLNDIYRCVTVM